MQRSWPLAVAVFLGVAATAVWAQEDDKDKVKPPPIIKVAIGAPAPELWAAAWSNYEGRPVLDRFKNRIVVMVFFRGGDKSIDVIPKVNELRKKYGPQGVLFVGMTPFKKEGSEKSKASDAKFPIGYEVDTDNRYQVAMYPMLYVIDPAGRLADRFSNVDALEEKIQAQLTRTPPIGFDAQTQKARLAQAEGASKNREYGKAHLLAFEVSRVAEKDSEVAKAAAEVVKKIEEAAKKGLEEARDAIKDEKPDKASERLAELSVFFAGESVGAEADTELGRLMGDNKLKPAVRKALDNAKGRMLNYQAADQEAAERYLEALKLYRECAEQYPETEAGKAAEAAIARIGGDPKIQEKIKALRDNEEAERWLDLAERFAKVELYGQAREYFQRVIENHPSSRAASKAKERLAKLPEEKTEDVPELPSGEEESGGGD